MTAADPSCRPTTAEALKSIQEYHDCFTRTQLKGPVPEANLETMTIEERFNWMREASARHAAREKWHLEEELVKTSAASS